MTNLYLPSLWTNGIVFKHVSAEGTCAHKGWILSLCGTSIAIVFSPNIDRDLFLLLVSLLFVVV